MSTKGRMLERLQVIMAGRAAEEVHTPLSLAPHATITLLVLHLALSCMCCSPLLFCQSNSEACHVHHGTLSSVLRQWRQQIVFN